VASSGLPAPCAPLGAALKEDFITGLAKAAHPSGAVQVIYYRAQYGRFKTRTVLAGA